ncbi:MAG: methylmalonyl-CoA mutase, partial [Candidatus Marinimicrobia bacterium]|nr:methylmalonyl-CoA mutase [Candidatus Neomarinimicrobiota bacterium]
LIVAIAASVKLFGAASEVQDRTSQFMGKTLPELNDLQQIKQSLDAITEAAKNSDNLMPLIINAAKNYATMGEIVDAMKVVFGEWEENAVI